MKRHRIGIRHEDKNQWERRAPLSPDHVAELRREHGIECVVQPASRRVFADIDYEAAGATISEDLSTCNVVLGIKEIPRDKLAPGQVYACFAHVAKGQPAGVPELDRYLELGCTLLDYEYVENARGRRQLFFGRYAGHAGMLDSLWALGQRLAFEGHVTPLENVRPTLQYGNLHEAMRHLTNIGNGVRHNGLPRGLRPVVVAFTGTGNVSMGAQEVFDCLPFEQIEIDELMNLPEDRDRPRNVLYKVVLPTEATVRRKVGAAGFDRAELRAHPDRYASALEVLLPHITMLINGVAWQPSQPRLVTRNMLRALWAREEQPKLRVIGDISCDIGGSIEATVKATTPGNPVYVYDAETDGTEPGVAGRGTVVMAVDNLPCELPEESSQHFGDSLLRLVSPLARCDFTRPFAELDLPLELHDAIIAHRGELTPRFAHVSEPLARFRSARTREQP